MTTLTVQFNVQQLEKNIKNHYTSLLKKGIRKSLQILLKELKRLTPEDTKEMVNSYKVHDIVEVNGTFIGIIGNSAEHAIYVEFGAYGKAYNYHKPKGSVFYTGVGNRTFARALDNKKKEMLAIITNAIGG